MVMKFTNNMDVKCIFYYNNQTLTVERAFVLLQSGDLRIRESDDVV